MKSKSQNKKKNECKNCKYYSGTDCTHTDNTGVKVKYRLENKFYIKTPEQLNNKGTCKNYAKA